MLILSSRFFSIHCIYFLIDYDSCPRKETFFMPKPANLPAYLKTLTHILEGELLPSRTVMQTKMEIHICVVSQASAI